MDFSSIQARFFQFIDWCKNTQHGRLFCVAMAVPVGWIFVGWLFYLSVWSGIYGKLPSKKDLASIRNYTASEVFSADSVLLGRFYLEDRSEVDYEDLPQHLIQGLIATEDARFFDHGGVDGMGMVRVFVKSILFRDKSSGGGSTLSQQLSKNLFKRPRLGPLSLPVAKFREAIIAGRLEKVYDKNEILALYLNTVPYGENVFGIGAASQRYFSKEPKDLLLEESAMLVGMLKATTAYNPRKNPSDAKVRRNVVLRQMQKYGAIDKAETDSLIHLPLTIRYRFMSPSDGPAPYFRQAVRSQLKDWFESHPRSDGSRYNLYTDGLKIYTTVDSRLQESAEAAVAKHMKYLQKQFEEHWKKGNPWDKQPNTFLEAVRRSERYHGFREGGMNDKQALEAMKKPVEMKIWTWDDEQEVTLSPYDSVAHYYRFLQTGLLAIHPQTGEVKAWVGGINHHHFKYDHVLSQRQVGSTFKPIVYAAALEYGANPCEYIPNEKVPYQGYGGWSPSNADGKYGGFYSMTGGLTYSVNTISAAVMQKVGIGNAIKFARKLGIESDLPSDPTLVLGTADITLLEMTAAYAAIANGGKYIEPHFVTKVLDREGRLVVDHPVAPASTQAMSYRTAGLITYMMRSVINRGTGASLRGTFGFNADIAGKTGTTQDQADGWFMGITPGLACGVWVGGPDRTVRFRSMSLGQGARTALPIWGNFMTRFYQNDMRFLRTPNLAYPPSDDSLSYECPLYIEQVDSMELEPILDGILQIFKRKTEVDSVRNPNTDRTPDNQSQGNTTFPGGEIIRTPKKKGIFRKKN